ncbi:DNA-binding protein [Undibacterium sp. JH2W]|uniref:DNA-binding protein n=1 Tax=Undibacterium sp. JH2W TaxID=3413037 RepID=UPI003BF0328D
MNTSTSDERMLLADIETLREQFTQTQDLYREVCAAMFFRYGMTPTANKLYQLVRKGSMSAPAEALNRFWQDLREKSRVKIEHPDLPEALKQATAAMAVSLWSTALEQSQESLSTYRAETAEQLIAANAAKEMAELEMQVMLKSQESLTSELTAAKASIQEREHEVTTLQVRNESLDIQLASSKSEIAQYQSRLQVATQEFTLELEKQRQTSLLAEERFRVAEKRALMEVDRERLQSGKLQKELDLVRSSMVQAQDSHQKEMLALQEQTGNLRQDVGSLQGQLFALTEIRDSTMKELLMERGRMETVQSMLITGKTEMEQLQKQLQQSREAIENLKVELANERASRENEKQMLLQNKHQMKEGDVD